MNLSTNTAAMPTPVYDFAALTPYKRCGACTTHLPLVMFGKDASRPDGIAKDCRECRRRIYQKTKHLAQTRDSRNHQARKAERYRARFEALILALPDVVLDRLPAELAPTPMQRRVARAASRKRSAGLPVRY